MRTGWLWLPCRNTSEIMDVMTALHRMSYRVRYNIKIMALRCFDPYIILRDLVYQYVKIGHKGHGISTGNAKFKKPMILKNKSVSFIFFKKSIKIGQVKYGQKI